MRDVTAPPLHPVRFFFGPPVGEISAYELGYTGENAGGRHRECEHNRFQAPSSVPSIYFRTAFVREVRTGHVALRCKYLTYGNRYIDRVHSTELLATSDSRGSPSGMEGNGRYCYFSGILQNLETGG